MTRNEFTTIEIGTPVTVFVFGRYAGVVLAKNPTVTIQGRTFVADGWLKVYIPGMPQFNGTYKDVDVTRRVARLPVAA